MKGVRMLTDKDVKEFTMMKMIFNKITDCKEHGMFDTKGMRDICGSGNNISITMADGSKFKVEITEVN